MTHHDRKSIALFRLGAWGWAFLLIVSVSVLAKSFLFPYSVDNAIYAYISKILLAGGEPYVATWDQNFPGVILFHLLHLIPFGTSIIGLHFVDSVSQLALAHFIIRLAAHYKHQTAGCIGALLSLVYYLHQGINVSAERDTFVTMLLFGAIVASLQKPRWLRSGLLIGVAVLIRPTYLMLLAPIILWLKNTHSLKVKHTGSLIAAAISLIVVVILWYLVSGHIEQMWEATVLYNLEVYNQPAGLRALVGHIRPYWLLLLGVIPAIVLLWRSPLLRVLLSMAAVLLINSLILSGLAYQYHPLVVTLIVISCLGWTALIDKAVKQSSVAYYLILSVLVPIILLSGFRGAFAFRIFYRLAIGQTSVEIERQRIYGSYAEEKAAIDFVNRTTHEQDRVQIFAGPVSVSLLANRFPSSRFITTHALIMRSKSGSLAPFQQRWRTEYLRDLGSRPPKLFLLANEGAPAWKFFNGRAGRAILDSDFVELARFVDSNYRLDTTIGKFTIYRHAR